MRPIQSIAAKSFDHVTLICDDLAATRRLYVDLMGMIEVPRPAFPFPGLWFELAGVQIHATQASDEAGQAGWGSRSAKKIARGHHIAFLVHDVAAAVALAESHGVPIASIPQIRPDGWTQAYLYDPDGHVVEVAAPPSSA